MRFVLPVLVLLLISCSNNDAPDVSHIKVDLKVNRFEQDLFKIDTNRTIEAIPQLIGRYPGFAENYFSTILNLDPQWGAEETTSYLNGFLAAYKKVYDSSQIIFKNFDHYKKELEKSVQYLNYYFPKYKFPSIIITYIGPLDGYGDILDVNAFIVGLHHHLGKDFSLYKTDIVNATYPEYISRRFEPSTIAVNSMKNVVNDMFPENFSDKALIIQMVEQGKRLFVLSKLLPEVKEHLLIGYTEKQLKESYDHENVIWDLFAQNNYLRSNDLNLIKNYVGEGPMTMELGEASPGNIGSFAGWQIVKMYMAKNETLPLDKLMATDPEKLFAEAKYKP